MNQWYMFYSLGTLNFMLQVGTCVPVLYRTQVVLILNKINVFSWVSWNLVDCLLVNIKISCWKSFTHFCDKTVMLKGSYCTYFFTYLDSLWIIVSHKQIFLIENHYLPVFIFKYYNRSRNYYWCIDFTILV